MEPREAAVFDWTFKEWLDSLIVRGHGGQIAMLERPERSIKAIQISQRSGRLEVDDAGDRHLSWWNSEYKRAREAICGPSDRAQSVVSKLQGRIQSLRGYRRLSGDCSGSDPR